MAAKAFVIYARGDASYARDIYQRLRPTLSFDSIFFDIGALPAGADPRDYFARQIPQSSILLVIVGPRKEHVAGDDWLDVAIRTARVLPIPILLVLVDNAEPPAALTSYQVLRLRSDALGDDIDRLGAALSSLASEPQITALAPRRSLNEQLSIFEMADFVATNPIPPTRGVTADPGLAEAARHTLNERNARSSYVSYRYQTRESFPDLPREQKAATESIERSSPPLAAPPVEAPRRFVRGRVVAPALLVLLIGTLIAGAFTDFGRSLFGQLFSLLGFKLGAGLIPPAVAPQRGEPTEDTVVCSIFGPPAAPPGQTILIQVFLHLPAQAERAGFLATAMDSSATLKGTQSLEMPVKRGAKVEISFSASGLAVDEPVQTLVWQGEPAFSQFLATIPQGTNGQSFFPIVRISIDGRLIGRIKFRIASEDTASQPKSTPLGDSARVYKYAFVSYATKDRKEVLKRVQMLAVLKTQFFQDILSLDPGDRWEKKLYENIDRSDLFLLFWSQAAKNSQWVIREAEYALKRQGQDPASEPDIVPVVLESNVAPPASLAALHFNDRIQYLASLIP